MAIVLEAPTTERKVARNPLKVVLALLMAIEAIFVALFAALLIWTDVALRAMNGQLRFVSVLPIALAGVVVVAVFLGAVTWVATVALWQDGWGRVELIGPWKRRAVWASLMLQGVFLAYDLLTQRHVGAGADASGLWPAVLLAGFGLGSSWRCGSRPMPGSGAVRSSFSRACWRPSSWSASCRSTTPPGWP